MKKQIFTLMLTLVISGSCLPCAVFAGTDTIEAKLADKKTYYTEESDYISGDCILTATRMMIRRAAIMNGREKWKSIKNETLRPEATVDGCLLSSFSFSSEGLTYEVGFGEFSGEDDASRIAEIESLLKEHPEGIVVHGDWAAARALMGSWL